MSDNYYLKILLNHVQQYYSNYTILKVAQFIESNLQYRNNKIKSLIKTFEYQYVRHHIVEFLKLQFSSSLICNNQHQDGQILIEFNKYKTDAFVIPTHENIRFCFSCCVFDTLDYSGSNLDKLEYEEFSHNQIKLLILPFTLLELKLNNSRNDNSNRHITSLSFYSYDIIHIAIFCIIPEIICIQNQQINKEILDFSQFSKLKVLHLDNISQDILLPDCLSRLIYLQNPKSFKYQIKLFMQMISNFVISHYSGRLFLNIVKFIYNHVALIIL